MYCAYCGSQELADNAATCVDCPVVDIICPEISERALFTGRMSHYSDANYFQLTLTADEFCKLARWKEKLNGHVS